MASVTGSRLIEPSNPPDPSSHRPLNSITSSFYSHLIGLLSFYENGPYPQPQERHNYEGPDTPETEAILRGLQVLGERAWRAEEAMARKVPGLDNKYPFAGIQDSDAQLQLKSDPVEELDQKSALERKNTVTPQAPLLTTPPHTPTTPRQGALSGIPRVSARRSLTALRSSAPALATPRMDNPRPAAPSGITPPTPRTSLRPAASPSNVTLPSTPRIPPPRPVVALSTAPALAASRMACPRPTATSSIAPSLATSRIPHPRLGGAPVSTPIPPPLSHNEPPTLEATEELRLLKSQIADVARVCNAVGKGDISQKITAEGQGDMMRQLKDVINEMVDHLSEVVNEVRRVSVEVGAEGNLGGQACVPSARGIWKDLTDNVNLMANNITIQTRTIAVTATAVARGDLTTTLASSSQFDTENLKLSGEMLSLANTISDMTEILADFATDMKRDAMKAEEVLCQLGTEAKPPLDVEVRSVVGVWDEIRALMYRVANRNSNISRECQGKLDAPLNWGSGNGVAI